MSLLAEPRRRRKQWRGGVGEDPQNLRWKNDKEKPGQRLMEQMGWREGSGLGADEQGMTENLRLKANHSSRGLGTPSVAEAGDTWIGHHNDFAKVLEELNAKKGENKRSTAGPTNSSEDNGKKRLKTKRRLLARVEDGHRAAIFGTPSGEKPHSPQPKSPMSASNSDDKSRDNGCLAPNEAPKLVVSQRSTTEYFRVKMEALAERKAKMSGEKDK